MLLRLALRAAPVPGAGPARAAETMRGSDAAWPMAPIPRRDLMLADDPARPVNPCAADGQVVGTGTKPGTPSQ
ncbi:hypothetical protein [Methylobacterium tarhaniae]|uniref:hypothetical protein n=1 Tax=Methylobacterium tarhaniae TaxID=1187852 RepID=UPI0012ECC0B0|nr:hypothetical protein [Methylobacterium tarhaniae]